MNADGTAVHSRPSLATGDDPRIWIPIKEAAEKTGVSVATIKSHHRANPDAGIARRIGTLWSVSRTWVETGDTP